MARIFQPGDFVKVNLADEGKEPRWVPATYRGLLTDETAVRAGDRPHLVYMGLLEELPKQGHTRRFPDDRIMKYVPTTDEAVAAFGEETVQRVHDCLLNYMEKLLLPDQRCKLRVEDGSVEIVNTPLSITPGRFETKSILGVMESPGWVVNESVTVSNYPHAPDDVDVVDIGTVKTPEDAARLAVRTLWNHYADYLFEREREVALAEAMTEPVPPPDPSPRPMPEDEIPF